MSILYAIILGAVQGLTEFLPVSSSGHLVLLQKIFGISGPQAAPQAALFFDTMLHTGTLSAVVAVLWQDVLAILRRLFQPLTGFLVLATIPAVIAALAFSGPIEHAFESGQFLGISFLVTSALLIIAELLSRHVRGTNKIKKAEEMNWIDALVIGVLQAIAIIPGVSRSGATISGALSRRLDRDFAARFSFLLSIPAILGALVLQLKDLAKNGRPAGVDMGALAAGTAAAAIVGFFAVKLMIKIIREKSLFGFAVYTAILGALILVDQFGTHFVF
jgi:undecaprenyl-diphosphatase